MRRRPFRRLFVRSSLPAWALTLVLAGLTGTFVHGLVSEAQAATSRFGELRAVPVAARAVPAGATLEDSDITERRLPAALVPEGEVAPAAVGHTTLVPLSTGEVILSSKLAPWGVRGAAALVPQGTRALAVPAGPTGRPPLSVGDRVDLLATLGTGQAGVATAEPTFPVARSALVVAVDDEADTVTVAVPTEDAPRLAFALTAGTVTIALTGPNASPNTSMSRFPPESERESRHGHDEAGARESDAS